MRQSLVTPAELKAVLAKPARRKYGNHPVMVCSSCDAWQEPERNVVRCRLCRWSLLRLDSKAEATEWGELRRNEKLGFIRGLARQQRFGLHAPNGQPIKLRSGRYPNGRAVVYVADFTFEEKVGDSWQARIRDTKGRDTPLSAHKRAHVEAEYGIPVQVTRKAAGRPAARRRAA